MKDTTPVYQDTALSEKGADNSSVAASAGTGDPEINKNLKVEQVDQTDQLCHLSDADAILVEALNNYASRDDAYDALFRLDSEMMVSGQARGLLNGQKYRAEETRKDLAQKEGKLDHHAHDRNRKYETIKGELTIIYRGMEQMCFAEGLDPSKMGIDLMLNDPDIQKMGKSESKSPQQQSDPQEDRLF